MHDAPTPTHHQHAVEPVLRRLREIRSQIRALLVIERTAWIVGAVLIAIGIVALLDFGLRTPDWFRIVLWLAGLSTLIGVVARLVVPAWRFRPDLTEVALRVERTDAGADLRGLLASGVDLGHLEDRAHPITRELSTPVVQAAAEQFDRVRTSDITRPARAFGAVGSSAGVVVLLVIALLVAPTMTRIGVTRVLAPWAGAEWPKRTGVVDITGESVHPMGSAIPLRAALVKGRDDTRVTARYRVITDGQAGQIRRVVLTGQGRTVDTPTGAHGILYERLIEPTGLSARTRAGDRPLEATLEYWFETEDDRSDSARLTLALPPDLTSAAIDVSPPPYMDRFGLVPQTIDLGTGRDERAAPDAMLAGSVIRLRLGLNKPVTRPEQPAIDVAAALPNPDTITWITDTLGGDLAAIASDPDSGFVARFDGQAWTVQWRLAQTVRLPVRPVDAYGIVCVEEASFRLEASLDAPPSATITEPSEDRSVLPSALVRVLAEARDDIGLDQLDLEMQVARRRADSEGAPPEPDGEAVIVSSRDAGHNGTDSSVLTTIATRLVIDHTIDLTGLDLNSGDAVWLSAIATDAYEIDGTRHDPVRSTTRVLRIISEDELVEQIWAELGTLRRSAIRVDEQQQEIMRATGRAGAADQLRDTQAGLTQRIGSQDQVLDRVRERMEDNGLESEFLDGVLREAEALQERAGEASAQAGEALGRVASDEATSGDGRAGDEQVDAALDAQDDVRDALADMIELLDQGEDIWTVKRSVERLLQEQRELQERTRELGEQTTGRSMDQLTAGEQSALEQMTSDQASLAERAAQAIEDMQSREQEMQESDPAAAQSMAQAAQTGQRQEVAEQMENASEQLEQNQTNNAQGQQEGAIEALEEMLEDLEDTARNRDEVLRRILASLIESIDGLIRQQETQLDRALAAKRAGDALAMVRPPLDRAMTRVHQNTLAVVDQANRSPREIAGVARFLEQAADAQAASIVALRDDPIDEDEVEGQERLSLDKLIAAKEEAERLDEEAADRQQQRARQALKQAYTEALRTQVQLRDAAQPLIDAKPTRRSRAAARQVGARQRELQSILAELLENTEDLSEAKMIEFAHRRLDGATGRAAAGLERGTPDSAVARDQAHAVRILQSIVEALDEDQDEQDFRQDEGGEAGGGGGGGGGEEPLVPPLAEVKLLRSLQQETFDITRDLSERPDAEPQEIESVGQLQRDLAEAGEELIDRLSQQNAPPTDIQPDLGPDLDPADPPSLDEEATP